MKLTASVSKEKELELIQGINVDVNKEMEEGIKRETPKQILQEIRKDEIVLQRLQRQSSLRQDSEMELDSKNKRGRQSLEK